MNVEIKPISHKLFVEFYNRKPERTINGYAFLVEEEVVAIAGYYTLGNAYFVFSDVKEGYKPPAVAAVRWSKKFLEMISKLGKPLRATSKSSEKFLTLLGFNYHSQTKYGKLFEYVRS